MGLIKLLYFEVIVDSHSVIRDNTTYTQHLQKKEIVDNIFLFLLICTPHIYKRI